MFLFFTVRVCYCACARHRLYVLLDPGFFDGDGVHEMVIWSPEPIELWKHLGVRSHPIGFWLPILLLWVLWDGYHLGKTNKKQTVVLFLFSKGFFNSRILRSVDSAVANFVLCFF